MNYLLSGYRVSETAIYQALHRRHSLPEEVLFFEGDEFPTCKLCGDQVRYRLLRRSTVAKPTFAEAAKAGK